MKVTGALILLLGALIGIEAKSVFKRSNGYGDEPLASSSLGTAAPAIAPVEQAVAPVSNPTAAAEAPIPSVQSSGYRKKRNAQNTYGDEVTNAPFHPAPVVVPVEQGLTGVQNPTAAAEAPSPSVQQSGYRKKRSAQNTYGDEVTFAPAPPAPIVNQVEQAPQPIQNPSAAAIAPAPSVQQSGYRKKRSAQNTYGDEVTSAPLPQAPVVVPVEQGLTGVQNPTAAAEAPSPSVQQSGYRKKRSAQNTYGDEPSAASVAPVAPVVVPVEQAVAPVSNPTAAAEAPAPSIQSSGYRKKRNAQNTYGDEVTNAPFHPAPVVVPVEQGLTGVQNPTAAAEAPSPSVQQSGYRKKRSAQNTYGDEATFAPAPPAPLVSQVEQAPQPIQNPSAAAIAPAPSVQSSGYRKKRSAQNAYGDEQTAFPATLIPVTNPAPVELPPVGVDQSAVGAQTSAVQASGY